MTGNRAHRPSLQGSVFWMAPEVVKQTAYTQKADIWSVGCLVVEMLTGEHPYPQLSQMQAIFKVRLLDSLFFLFTLADRVHADWNELQANNTPGYLSGRRELPSADLRAEPRSSAVSRGGAQAPVDRQLAWCSRTVIGFSFCFLSGFLLI